MKFLDVHTQSWSAYCQLRPSLSVCLRARLDGLNKSSFKKVLLKVLKLIFKISKENVKRDKWKKEMLGLYG